jgi:YVTN family beta-propeller protein
MRKLRIILFLTLIALFAICARSQVVEPLRLIGAIPMPDLHDGDFDHLTADVQDNLLFVAAEENHSVEVIDLKSNKVIHSISGLKAPHSITYRSDVKKLFVADGNDESGEVKIFQGDSYNPVGSVKLRVDADSSVYDPSTHYMYVVNGGGTHAGYVFISIVDTTTATKVDDIKVDSDSVEAMALEKSGPRMFANLYAKGVVAVIDRNKHSVIATWPIAPEGSKNSAIAFDEADHRLFVVAREPGKVLLLDSDSGKILNSLPCFGHTDDAVFDPASRRLYVIGETSIDIFQLLGANRFRQIGQVPSTFRTITGTLVPELNRYYVAVPHHGQTPAQILIYEVVP